MILWCEFLLFKSDLQLFLLLHFFLLFSLLRHMHMWFLVLTKETNRNICIRQAKSENNWFISMYACVCVCMCMYVFKILLYEKKRVSVRVWETKLSPTLCANIHLYVYVLFVSLLPSSMVAAKTAIASRRRSNLCCQVLNLRPLLLSAKQNSKKKLFF